MNIEKETETIITLDGDYSVDITVDGEFEWDIATNEGVTEIKIVEREQ